MKKGLFTVLVAVAVVTLAGVARASDVVVTLENVAERIRAANPDLGAARLRIEEAVGRVNQAGRWANPELDLSFAGNSGYRERTVEVGFSQRFPITGRLGIERSVARIEVKAEEAEIAEVERLLVAEARAALVDILALRQQGQLRQQQAELSQQLASFVEKHAQRGELSPIDAGQAQLEATRLASDVRQLRANEVAAIARLRSILGMSIADVVQIEGELPPAALPDGSVDPARRPGFQSAELQAEAAELGVELEKARRYEDFEAGLVAGVERAEDVPAGFDSEFVLGFQLKVPLPFWNNNGGSVEAARARASRKQREAAALSYNIQHEAEVARLEMLEWSTMLNEITDSLLPLAINQAAAAERAYRQGLGDLQAVLRAREQRLQLGASRIDTLRNFHHARVRFDAAVANH